MEYYLAFKKEETLSYATTWTEFEGLMINETSQSQKDKYCMTALTHGT